MIKMNPDDSGAIPLFEAYVLVKDQLRDLESQMHAGRGQRLKPDSWEKELWEWRGRELQVEHARQKYDEAWQMARLRGDEEGKARYGAVERALDMLRHCMSGKGWAHSFLHDDPTVTVASMYQRCEKSEKECREHATRLMKSTPLPEF